MANWLNRTTKQHIARRSPRDMEAQFGGAFVDGSGNAQGNATWILQPDLSAVAGIPSKYWNIVGDVVSEMSGAEKSAVDQTLLDERRDNAVSGSIDSIESVVRALALATLDEINVLRAQHSLADRTMSQLKTSIRNKLGT